MASVSVVGAWEVSAVLSVYEQRVLARLEADLAADRRRVRWGRAVRLWAVAVWRLRWVVWCVLLAAAGTAGLSAGVVEDRVGWGVLAGAAGWSLAVMAVPRLPWARRRKRGGKME